MIFDEEFIGGKGLQGSCSQFRGRLAPWSDLLLVSRSDEFQDFKKGGGKGGKNAAKPAWTTNAPVVSPTGKKNSAGATPAAAAGSHPVKQVLQRPAHAVASPPAKASYASAAVAMDSHGKPVLKQDSGTSVGQKLLKALQKEDKDKQPASVISPASKVAILKKKIGIPDQPASSSASAAPVSNGTGVNILAEAAGFSVADIGKDETLLPSSFSLLPHHPMMGVISYQAQQASGLNKSSLTTAPVLPTPPSAAAAGASHSVHPPHAPPRVLGAKHTSPQKQRPATAAAPSTQHQPTSKLVLNKEATRRIVTHELKPNGPTTHAGVEKKKAVDGDVHAAPEHSGAVPHAKVASGATLLATMKKNQDKKPVSDAKPSTPSEAAPPAATATSTDATATPAATAVTAPLTMAEKLANAKKAMKEKQAKMALLKKSADAADQAPSAPITVTSPSQAIKKTASGEHKKEKEVKKEDSHEKKAAAPSIVSILTKAKQAAASTSNSAEKEKPVHAHTAAPAAHHPVHTAPAGIHAPEPHHVPAKVSVVHKGTAAHAPATVKGDAAAGASITDILKNAKRAAPAASSDGAAASAPAPAAASHAVSPTAALKKKAPSSLVPSKVIITKSK